jgi:hypothetical protein
MKPVFPRVVSVKTARLFLSLLCLLLMLPFSVIAQEFEVAPPLNDFVRALNEIMVSRITRAVFEQDISGHIMILSAFAEQYTQSYDCGSVNA